jgi:hypothetical protein
VQSWLEQREKKGTTAMNIDIKKILAEQRARGERVNYYTGPRVPKTQRGPTIDTRIRGAAQKRTQAILDLIAVYAGGDHGAWLRPVEILNDNAPPLEDAIDALTKATAELRELWAQREARS